MHPVVRRARAALAALAAGLAVAAVIVLPTLTALVPTAPAAAGQTTAPAGPPPPGAVLTLTIRRGTSPHGPLLAAVTLTCDPDGGSHPRPEAACDSLRAVDGRLGNLPTDTYLCPLYVDRVTGRATGYWRGTRVRFVHTATNRCALARETDQVFGF